MNKRGQYFALAMIVVLILVFSWAAPFSRSIKFEKQSTTKELFDNFAEELPFVVNNAIIKDDLASIDRYITDYSSYLEGKGMDMEVFYLISLGNMSIIKNSLDDDALFAYDLHNMTVEKSTKTSISRNKEEYVTIGTEEYLFTLSKEPSVNMIIKISKEGNIETYVYENKDED